MLVKVVKPDFEFNNESGSLTQLVHEGWNQVNVLFSKKDSVRGGHYHKINHELFYIINGKLELKLTYNGEEEKSIFETGGMFIISPYQIHNFTFLEDTTMIAMYDIGVELDDGNKDIYTE